MKSYQKCFQKLSNAFWNPTWLCENLHTSIPQNSSQTILREYDHFHEDRGHAKLLPPLRDPLLMYLVPTATCNMIKMLRFNAAMFVMCRQWLTDNIVFSSARSWGHQQTSLYNSEIKYSHWVKLVSWLATFNQNAFIQCREVPVL